MKNKIKHYKLGGRYYAIDTRFGRFEKLQEKLNDLGLDFEFAKKIILGSEKDPEQIAKFGVESAIQLFSSDNLRSILATILVHKPLVYRIPIVGEYLFNKFNKFSEEQIEETKRLLANASFTEAEGVMNDFFYGMINSMILSYQSSNV